MQAAQPAPAPGSDAGVPPAGARCTLLLPHNVCGPAVRCGCGGLTQASLQEMGSSQSSEHARQRISIGTLDARQRWMLAFSIDLRVLLKPVDGTIVRACNGTLPLTCKVDCYVNCLTLPQACRATEDIIHQRHRQTRRSLRLGFLAGILYVPKHSRSPGPASQPPSHQCPRHTHRALPGQRLHQEQTHAPNQLSPAAAQCCRPMILQGCFPR
jgi:hypothetical protein